MAKARVIIADTDENYILPLQLKFAEDFYDKIDLEIISDRDYFNSVFSTPQKAEILVVSEALYDVSLQRHSIGNVFLMTETFEEEQTGDLNATRIYKYTSIKEIFNEITGKSAKNLNVEMLKKTEPQIVVVCSAIGGVGKTTVALGMAASLARNYKRVLYINASWLQSFQRMLENESPISTGDVYSKLTKGSERIYEDIKHVVRKEIFSYLPPFKASLMSLGLEYGVFEAIAVSAKKSTEYDYVIVDSDTQFDDEKASLIGVADRVVIVTSQNAASVYATNLLVSNINGISNDKYVFICNDFNKEEDNALISPATQPKFIVNEYVEHIAHYDLLKAVDLASYSSIGKASILVM